MTDDTRPATVLVVEDEPALAELYVRFLEPTYSVLVALDGTEALETMSDDVDVVLLDRRMPDLLGEEVLEVIREEGFDCRVAMVTAVAPDIDIIEMGFDHYVTKPIEKDDLLRTVDQLLELDTYDELVQEFYQLASKKVTLENENPDVDLASFEEFARLTDRLAELDAELRTKQDALAGLDFRSLLDRPESSGAGE